MSRKILHFAVFLIVLIPIWFLFSICYNNKCLSSNLYPSKDNLFTQPFQQTKELTKSPIFKVSIISDTHLNDEISNELKESIKLSDSLFLIHAGDLSNYGTESELIRGKNFLDSLGISYYAIPGDHDIAQTSSDSNFNKYFSYPSKFSIKNVNFLIIPNFYNFTPLEENLFQDIIANISLASVIVSPQPIFVNNDNIFSNKYMGSPTAFDDITPNQALNLTKYDKQRLLILDKLRETSTNKIVISGDHHRSSTFIDPVNSKIKYHIVGSLAKYIYMGNTQLLQTSLQSRRFSVLSIYNSFPDFDFKIEELEIK